MPFRDDAFGNRQTMNSDRASKIIVANYASDDYCGAGARRVGKTGSTQPLLFASPRRDVRLQNASGT
jgi:hypothetical protein